MRRSMLALALLTAAGMFATPASAQTSTSPTGPAFEGAARLPLIVGEPAA